MSRTGYFSPAPPRVLAHRGLALAAPENTLLAFLHALNTGVTHIETDAHATSDGVAVLSHDDTLKRIAGDDIPVSRMTMAELRKIPLGHDQGFCSLAEALDTFPQARFNIDVKSADAVGPTVEAVRSTNATDRVLIGSFSARRRKPTIRMLPGVATSVSGLGVLGMTIAANLGIAPLVRLILRDVDAVQLPAKIGPLPTATARIVRQVHSAGAEVHIWTINDPGEMIRLLDAGVDGIVTDRCDVAMTLLNDRA